MREVELADAGGEDSAERRSVTRDPRGVGMAYKANFAHLTGRRSGSRLPSRPSALTMAFVLAFHFSSGLIS